MKGAKAKGRFGKQDFIYLPDEDAYRCPAGERLGWRFSSVEDGLLIHKYWTSNCGGCGRQTLRARRYAQEVVRPDDPFRSLVGELIRAGGCAKTGAPFYEFLWAAFLRRRIERPLVEKDFGSALVKALDLAKGADAKSLPGWSGADPAAN